MKCIDIIIRIINGSFLLIAIPGLIAMIKDDIKTMKELKERDLI